MRLCNETITVFNAKLDKESGFDVLYGTVIDGVSWYYNTNAGITSNGYRSADTATIRIPTDADFGGKSFIQPKQWEDTEDVSSFFTLKPDTILVRGAVETDGQTARELKSAYETITVTGVTDNRRAPNAPHWRVTGV